MWPMTPLTGRTFAQFSASLGDRARHLPAIYAAFGLATPLPETELREDEQATIRDFVEAWGLLDDRREVYLRAARIAGEGIRRADLATLDLFDELGGSPPQRQQAGYSDDEAILPSNLLGALMPRLYQWLHVRHLEHEVFERIVSYVERAIASAGAVEHEERQPPAIAFIDLTGYTALTQTVGDELAARKLLVLQELAEAAAQTHGGRIVKLLGDGVMLRYESARGAVASMLALLDGLAAADLPPAHAGIADGTVVSRDGDVFGHTVNLAARIGSHASAGQLLVTRSMLERLDPDTRWEDAGVVPLKGIEEAVPLVRIIGA
jgi:adenylate cyclase